MKDRVEQIANRFHESAQRRPWTLSWTGSTIRRKLRRVHDNQLKDLWAAQRKAEFFIDLVEAENSTGTAGRNASSASPLR